MFCGFTNFVHYLSGCYWNYCVTLLWSGNDKLCDHTYLICFILCCKPKTNVPCNINSNLQQKKEDCVNSVNLFNVENCKKFSELIPEERRDWLTPAVNLHNKSGLIKTSSWQTKFHLNCIEIAYHCRPAYMFYNLFSLFKFTNEKKKVQCLESQKARRTAMSALQRYQFYSFTLLLTVSSESQASWGQVGISSILSSL